MLLQKSLDSLPPKWALTPVHKKVAYLPKWASCPIDRSIIAHELNSRATGFGLITGVLSGGIMAIDCDGHLPHALLREILGTDIPQTVAFTSGKDGRGQYLFAIPQVHWARISTKKAGKAKDGGMLEFRWDGCQSVLPPSKHPETGVYKWVNPPDTTAIAMLPAKILDYLTTKPAYKPTTWVQTARIYSSQSSIPLQLCLSRIHRQMLEYGVSQGERHIAAVRLARDLVGASSRLTALGESYEGDPESLYWDFCARCSPPLPGRERDQIWRSTKSGNFAPSINNAEAFQRCINAWHRKSQLS